MCEQDEMIDAWFRVLEDTSPGQMGTTERATYLIGYLRGTVREMAATVPGVRDYLLANFPERV